MLTCDAPAVKRSMIMAASPFNRDTAVIQFAGMDNNVVSVRSMVESDVDVVAGLHVASWRSAYRGLMSDDYLDRRAPADRRAHWQQRLAHPSGLQAGLVAEHGAVPVGFAYLVGDADPRYGTLLDNLHVRPGMRGAGIGRLLLASAAREIASRGWPRGLYLWVFEANSAAHRFYERHGAVPVERALLATSDGSTNPAVRYAWDDATTLALRPT